MTGKPSISQPEQMKTTTRAAPVFVLIDKSSLCADAYRRRLFYGTPMVPGHVTGEAMFCEKHPNLRKLSRRQALFTCAGVVLAGDDFTPLAKSISSRSSKLNGSTVLPEAFGAQPSSTASSATVDQTANLQAALNYLSGLQSQGTLLLNGWYAVANLVIPSGVSIVGRSQAASGLVKFGTLNKPMVSLAPDAKGLLFEDLSFDGGNGLEPQVLLALGISSGSSTTFHRVTFQNGCSRAAVRGDWASPQHDLNFKECRFINLPGGGVQLLPTTRGSRELYFENNIFEAVGGSAICIHHGNATGDAEYGYNQGIYLRCNSFVSPLLNRVNGDAIPVEIWGWDGGECVDNHVDGGTRGLAAGAGSRNVLYARNHIMNQTRYAFECGKMRSCIFRNNVAVNCPSMFAFTGGGEEGFDIFDVEIRSNYGIGTGLDTPTVGIDYISGSNQSPVSRNLRIIDNQFFDLEYIRSAIRLLTSQAVPTIAVVGDGSGATATATLKAVGGRIIEAGAGYVSTPKVIVSGGGGTGAAFACSLNIDGSIAKIKLVRAGSGYSSAPDLILSGGGGHGAVIDASMGIEALAIVTPGSGYSKADIAVTNNGGSDFEGTVQIIGGSVVAVSVLSPGKGFGRGSTIDVEGNRYVARTYNSCANGYQIDGAHVTVRKNLWKRLAAFDSHHYQGNDAVAYRQPTFHAWDSSAFAAVYSDNSAEMFGGHDSGTLIAFGANSRQPLSTRIRSEAQVCHGVFSGRMC